MTLVIRQILQNRYRIESLLGQGGYGAVYKATDLHIHAAVAVKENEDTLPEAQRQFAREADLLVRLRHPCLPRVTDCFLMPGQGQYLVMDYVEGLDLQQTLEQTGPTVAFPHPWRRLFSRRWRPSRPRDISALRR